MAVIRLATNATGAAPYTSATFNPDLAPDQYGTVVVTHSGSRLSPSSTVAAYLQGSLDNGTTWFDIEVMKPSDTVYINGTLNSWCRVVPLVKSIRLQVLNSTGLTLNAWVIE
jgi:hypothetical protein